MTERGDRTTDSGIELPESVAPEDLEAPDEEREEEDGRGIGGRVVSASPLVWVLLAAAVGWAIWATVSGGGDGRAPARAVVIPTADTARTVIALPCSSLRGGGGSGAGVPAGAITTVLPEGGGSRTVAVTGCRGSGAGAAQLTGEERRTALIVMPPGVRVPAQGSAPVPGVEVTSVTRVPAGVDARTIVIPPCPTQRRGGGGRPQVRPLPESLRPSGGGVLLVPCPSEQGS